MFINTRIHTDVKSVQVLSVSGNKATVISVVKRPKDLLIIPGGFAGHSPNQEEAYRNGEIIQQGDPFEVVFHKGCWGRWHTDSHVSWGVSDDMIKDILSRKEDGLLYEVFPDEHGTNTLVITTLTPKGKKKRWFQKLGQMEETCRYFYDHNF